MNLCIVSEVALAKIAVTSFILGWTHTVEKMRWEENWAVTPAGLVMREARVQGSGAGIDPPPDARFDRGRYRWKPNPAPQAKIALARSNVPGDWEICFGRAGCAPLSEWAGSAPEVVLKACP